MTQEYFDSTWRSKQESKTKEREVPTSHAALMAFSLELRGILTTKSVNESLFVAITWR